MENQAPPLYPVQSVDHVLQLLLMLKRDGLLRAGGAPTSGFRLADLGGE